MADRQDPVPASASAPAKRPRVRQRFRTPQEASAWRRRMAGYGLFGIACVLVVNALVGENGYLATVRSNRDRAELTRTLRQLREENAASQEEILRLNKDPGALEDAARKGPHLSKPGERMIILKDQAAPKPPPAPPAR